MQCTHGLQKHIVESHIIALTTEIIPITKKAIDTDGLTDALAD